MLEEQQYQRSAAFQEHVESATAARYTSNAQDYVPTRPTAVSPPPFIDRGATRGNYARNGRTSPLSASSPLGSISKPRTYRDWLSHAKLVTAGAMQNGFSSPVIWMYVKGTEIPPNAVVWGDDNGRPLYVCRSFYEGKMHLGKAASHLRLGAVISYNGVREIEVAEYEVLVEAQTFRWTFQESSSERTSSRYVESSSYTVSTPVSGGADHEDPGLQRLSELKTVVIVDDSLSMSGERWNDARNALANVAEQCGKYGADGLDLYFLNNPLESLSSKDRGSVLRAFEKIDPIGQTPTGTKLKEILDKYIPLVENKRASHKPINIIVITDGAATDDPAETIVEAARRLDQNGVPHRQLGIQFVQIGNDLGATEALKELDNELEYQYQIRDMVDTTLFDPKNPQFKAETLLKIMMGAVDQTLDRGYPFRSGLSD